jgi:DNA invertase Pin-like site-specific DNA recombinase
MQGSANGGIASFFLPNQVEGFVMLVGYARVSSGHQDLQLQLDAFDAAGVARVYYEKRSAVVKRPELERLLSEVRSGDVVVVWKLDRLARSLSDLLSVVDRLKGVGVGFRSLTEYLDTTNPLGVFTFQVLGAVAQLERSMIRERAIAGQVAAYKRGVRWGGGRAVLTPTDREAICRLKATGVYPASKLASMYGVSLSTVFRVLSPNKPPRIPVLSRYM